MKTHQYETSVEWTGNSGTGTSGYRNYERSHTIRVNGKAAIHASSDPSFRGDNTRYNPEELLVASIASCHMLWFLHLCSDAGIVVTAYTDQACGTMVEGPEGGRFTEVVLRPAVTIASETDAEQVVALHSKAHQLCFIANSVNFPVRHEPTVQRS